MGKCVPAYETDLRKTFHRIFHQGKIHLPGGELYGVQPTGKKVMVTGISIERIAGGKIAETWVNFDALGMLQQLGVVPTMG